MGEVDGSFIEAVEHRPKLSITEAEGIPLVDLSVSNTLGDACKNWGFLQVINHGVPLELRENVELDIFLRSLKGEKLKVKRDGMNISSRIYIMTLSIPSYFAYVIVCRCGAMTSMKSTGQQ